MKVLILLAMLCGSAAAQSPNCSLVKCAAQISWTQPCASCTVTVYSGPPGAACNPLPVFTPVAENVPAAGPWVDTRPVQGQPWKACYSVQNVQPGVAAPSAMSAHVEVWIQPPAPPAVTNVTGSVIAQ